MSPSPAIPIEAAIAASVEAQTTTPDISLNSATASTVHAPTMTVSIDSATSSAAEAPSASGINSVTASAVEAPTPAVGIDSSGAPTIVAPAVVLSTVTSTVSVDSVTSVAGRTLHASVTIASETTTTPLEAKAASEAGVVSTMTNVPTTNIAIVVDSSTTAASHMANPMDVDLPELSSSAASAIGKVNDTNKGGTGNFVTDSRSHFQTLATASPGWARLIKKWAEFEKHCSGTEVRVRHSHFIKLYSLITVLTDSQPTNGSHLVDETASQDQGSSTHQTG